MTSNWKKRVLSLLLSFALLLGNFPAVAYAAAENGLCEHHNAHTDCGYEEGVSDCNYHCAVCEVVALIDALPTLETIQAKPMEEQGEDYTQVNAAYDAYVALSDDQKALLPYGQAFFDPYLAYFSGQTQEAIVYSGSCGDTANWSLDTVTGVLTISGTGPMADYASYDAHPWYSHHSYITSIIMAEGITHIGEHAFNSCRNVTSVSIPESVGSIGKYAFAYCSSLTAVTIPDSTTTIGNSAFMECENIASLVLGNGLTEIGERAFQYCKKITSLVIPEGITVLNEKVFASCHILASVTLPSNLKTIGPWAFQDCAITTLTIPEGVTTIGESALSICGKMVSVTIPKSVTEIGPGAFGGCYSLENVYYSGTQSKWGSIHINSENNNYLLNARKYYAYLCTSGHSYGSNGICSNCGDTNIIANGICGDGLSWELNDVGILIISGTGAIAEYGSASDNRAPWYEYREQIRKIVIEDGVTSLGRSAFSHCVTATDVTIPDSVTDLGAATFAGCTGLTEITLPSGLTNIGESVFSGCTKLQSVNIPQGVTSISNYAFQGCSFLASVSFPTSLTSIGQNAFENCDSLTSLSFPSGLRTIDYGAFMYCDGLTSVKFPDACTGPASKSFAYCSNLENVTLGKSCTVLTSAFSSCPKLVSITAPENVRSIEVNAFSGCTALTTLTFTGNALTSINTPVFHSAANITIRYPGLDNTWPEFIEKYTNALTPAYGGTLTWEAYFPNVTASGIINNTIQWKLYADGTMVISGSGSIPFYDTYYGSGTQPPWSIRKNEIKKLIIESGITGVGQYAFHLCQKLEKVTLPAGITIYDGAFYETGLTSLTLPENTTLSGHYPIFGFSPITSITIPGTATISMYAFSHCESLLELNLGSGLTEIPGSAFMRCEALEKVTIPATVTTIGSCAFENCISLKEVVFEGDAPTIDTNVFRGETLTAYYPAGNETWTADKLQPYGGSVTWIATCGNHSYDGAEAGYTWSEDYSKCTAYLNCVNNGCQVKQSETVNSTVVTNDATCTKDGVTTYTATFTSNIFETQTEEITIPGGHSFVEGVCEKCGEKENSCAEGHEWKDATCTAPKTCSVCGTTEGDPLGHTYDREVVDAQYLESAATCVSPAVYYMSCECGAPGEETFTDGEIDHKAHQFVDGVCKYCGNFGGKCGESVWWTLDDSGNLIVYGNGAVTFDGPEHWRYDHRDDIKTAVVRDGVTDIGDMAFNSCSHLISVALPEGLSEIPNSAFQGCSQLKTVNIPASITQIVSGAFDGCSSLTDIYIADIAAWLNYSDDFWSYGHPIMQCNELRKNLYLNGELITNLEIPDGVTRINTGAFFNCNNLQSVTIGNDVEMIAQQAFVGCANLKTVTLLDGLLEIGHVVFSGCTALETITIPNSVTEIGSAAFNNCSSLQTIDLPDNLRCISGNLFEGCVNLQSVEIPDTITSIGENAFSGCSSLESIYIPSAVTEIGQGAFSGCRNMVDVYITDIASWVSLVCGDENGHPLGMNSQSGPVPSAKKLYLDGELIKDVVIPEGVTTVAPYSFYGCTQLESITVPESVTDFGVYCFYGCYNLTDVYITDLVSWITISSEDGYDHPFDYAEKQNKLYLNEKLVTKAVIPEGITDLGFCAFAGCSDITEVSLPEGLVNIGNFAFQNCDGLTHVTIPDSVKRIGAYSFADCDGLTTIDLGEGVTEIWISAFQDCEKLEKIVIPDSVTRIYDNAFCNCPSLRSMTIPDGVTIAEDAGMRMLSGCDNLTDIYFGGTLETWEETGYTAPENDWRIHPLCTDESSHWETKTAEATCTQYSYTYELCACGHQRNQQTIGNTYQHAWGAWTEMVAATCGAKGEERRDCNSCDHYETRELAVDASNHVGGTEIRGELAATCTVDGYSGDVHCSTCGGKITDGQAITAPGHTMGDWAKISVADCVTKGKERRGCDYCDFEETRDTSVNPDNHTGDEYEVRNASQATCTKEGYSGDTYCLSCGGMAIRGHVLSASGHSWGAWGEATPSTCIEKGTERRDCNNCDHFETRETSINGSNHVGGTGVKNAKTATCTENGYTGDAHCKSCGEKLTEGKTVAAIGHSYTSVVTAPTCTEKGYSTHTCACGDSYVDSEKSALGHTGGTATCIEQAVCTRCAKPYGEKNKQNHVGGTEVKNAKAATCTENGYTGDTHCKSCGEKLTEGETVAATGHSYTSVVTAPTCTEKGYTTHTCACGDKFVDTYKDVLGHDMGQWKMTEDITCTEDGSRRRDCSRCDYYETGIIESKGHSYSPVVTSATCTEKGYITHTCSICGDSYVDTYVDALEHEMGEWTVVKEATPDANGEEKRICSRCDHAETRELEYKGNVLAILSSDLLNVSSVWIDGVLCEVVQNGDTCHIVLPEGNVTNMVSYSFNNGDGKDIHTQYPTGMRVWRLTKNEAGTYSATYVKELDNILQYSGSSIRITGNKGIRMITSVTKDNKAALTGKGLAGYKLVEYGTALCWAKDLEGGKPMVLGQSYVKSNYAYKRGVADPVFAYSGNLVQYTNVLVGFSLDQCKDDIAMRPYITLEDANGEQITIYGGIVYRSIGYIAYQNRNVFKPGNASYDYVWEIIHHVYGKEYDADYKG